MTGSQTLGALNWFHDFWNYCFGLFFLTLILFLAVFLFVRLVLTRGPKPDPTPDNVPYEIPLRRIHNKGEGTRIHWSLLVLMNGLGAVAAAFLYAKIGMPQFRASIDFSALIAAAIVMEALLILYVYVGMTYTAYLTIDEYGVQMKRWGKPRTYRWKDLSDAPIVYTYSRNGTPIPHLRVLQRDQAEGDGTDIMYPGLNMYRLRETILKGIQTWGDQTSRKKITEVLKQESQTGGDIDSDAKRTARGLRGLKWGGLIVLIMIPAALLMGFAEGRFIPDATAFNLGSIAAGVIVFGFVFYLFRSVTNKVFSNFQTFATVSFGVLVLLLTILYFGFIESTIALPDLYTKLYGQSAVRQVTVINWRPATHGRHSTCAGVTITELPSLLGRLCFDRQVAPGTSLVLHGRQSLLGFHVDAIE